MTARQAIQSQDRRPLFPPSPCLGPDAVGADQQIALERPAVLQVDTDAPPALPPLQLDVVLEARHDGAVQDDVAAAQPPAAVCQDGLQLHPADDTCHWQPGIGGRVEGVELAVPVPGAAVAQAVDAVAGDAALVRERERERRGGWCVWERERERRGGWLSVGERKREGQQTKGVAKAAASRAGQERPESTPPGVQQTQPPPPPSLASWQTLSAVSMSIASSAASALLWIWIGPRYLPSPRIAVRSLSST